MMRDLKIFRRNCERNPNNDVNNENLPMDPAISSASQLEADPSRPPFNTIQEFVQNPKRGSDQEAHFRRKNEKTPSKCQTKGPDQFFQFRTPPEKMAAVKSKFGWVPKNDQPGSTFSESKEDSLHQGQFQMPPPTSITASYAINTGNGYCAATRSITTGGKASSVHSGTSSTQSTPTKSVTKPMFNGGNSRAPQCGGTAKALNLLVSSKGIPVPSPLPTIYAQDEVPHFDLKEDPSFWMDHNVQVVIRARPINEMERSLHGYSRCIKQESAQSITWIGQPDTRFMFDYVACETIDQDMLFRVAGLPMVENCMSGYNSCVFAYGQTGSGKTHTMLGEINDLEIRPSANRGMTPRIFEFLFARIKAEEESRRDEKLEYSCKCSFLEIYNEQITDLLNPSATNLLIREDPRKGVHVENLSEFEVENVYDILKLLIQGAANRKVAATNMNRESSRSHSVFTCTIESRWQKDSANTLRSARLNLVDLAGSERQKTSGAEGDRLKEASNINKSLSTLGHVIMVLADLANGRQRHVPYRDSRLTFLLQDSLGGNSKTMIIANVSPSIGSMSETMSTLKFAQRAKIIQNNAVVNENASGDVFALQHQIHLLKEELSMLKQQNVSRSLSFRRTLENAEYDTYSPSKLPGVPPKSNQMHESEELQIVRISNKMMKSFEATLAGALRREKMIEASMKQLEAEIEHLNRLVHQREEDIHCSKMLIKFREDKICRMEALLNELIPTESYLSDENYALSEEIKLLQTKIDSNPEVTRFARENIRLIEQLRKFQDFYEEGERELLLADLSELRNQLVQILDGKFEQEQHSKSELNGQDHSLAFQKETPCSCNTKHAEEVLNLDLELDILKTIVEEEKAFRIETEERAILVETELSMANEKLLQISKKYDVTMDELMNARSVNEALESQQILLINELEELRENNNQLADVVKKQEQEIFTMRNQLALRIDVETRKSIAQETSKKGYSESDCSSPLQKKLKRVQASLEKAWNLNMKYQSSSDQASPTSNEKEMDEVRRQAEAETAEAIVSLQEELAVLSQLVDDCNKNEFLAKQRIIELENESKEQDDKVHWLAMENTRLSEIAEEKEQNMRSVMEDWEQLMFEIAELLENGNVQIDNASYEVTSISDTLSPRNWICQQFSKICSGISDKDFVIKELQRNLEAARDLEWKVRTLRGATLAITEAHQQENCDKENEILHLTSQLDEKMSIISKLKNKVEDNEKNLGKVGLCAAIFFITANKLHDINKVHLQALNEANLKLRESEKFIQKPMHLGTCTKNVKGKTIPSGLVETNMKIKELQIQLSTLKSCVHEYAEEGNNPVEVHSPRRNALDENRANIGSESAHHNIENSVCNNLKKFHRLSREDIFEREKTIEILRKEIESALQSLKDVQSQMAEMLNEKKEIKMSMLLSHNRIEGLTAKVDQLSSEILNKGREYDFKLHQLEEKLRTVEEDALTFNSIWRKEKEELDLMINESSEANKIAKLEIDRLKKTELSLYHENCSLASKLQSIQAFLDEKDDYLEHILKFSNSNTMEAMDLVFALKNQFMILNDAFVEKFTMFSHDLDELKSSILQQHRESRMLLEEIWLGIIGKECALSVLQLCHVGILLERITGLNAENCFLQNGLSESNSLVTNLREQNIKSEKELKMCSALKGKLLLDINNSFAQIVKKEHETSELSAKLNSFEERIAGLQFIEGTMLERSNSIAAELDILKDELTANKEISLRAAIQEKLMRDNEVVNKRLEDLSLLLEEAQAANKSLRDELDKESNEKVKVFERLEKELFNMNNLLSQKDHLLDELKEGINSVKQEKNNLESQVSSLNKKLALVEGKEANAVEHLEKMLMDNEELTLRLKEMSKMLDECRKKDEVIKKESDIMKIIAIERLKKELCAASVMLGEKDQHIEELQNDKFRITHKNYKSESKETLKLAKPIVEEDNAAATEASHRKLLMENEQLKLEVEHMTRMFHEAQVLNQSLHEELEDKMMSVETLQRELLDLNTLLSKRNHNLQKYQKEMATITHLKEKLESQVSILKEQLEMAESLAEENEAVATEARQIAEERRSYAQIKEEEAKLLERSVEELECTVNTLQEQVKIVKEEAERQGLQRDELEMEVEQLKFSNNFWKIKENGHFDISRHLKEKVSELKDAQHTIQLLQEEAADKDLEIARCKSTISELNLLAEAQAREYKRKFNELEAMAFQVRTELINPNTTNITSTKFEKGTGKSRGSGSPFKCIGLGLTQQINSEKEEELTVARCKIEELEALAASRQKQIFTLNIRLAAAESMTHDVHRDLLSIKLDMTKYTKMNESAQSEDAFKEKDKEWGMLKKQVDEFVQERQSLLDAINQRDKELIAQQICLEKLQEHAKLLTTENELLKADNVKYKNMIMKLEEELDILSS